MVASTRASKVSAGARTRDTTAEVAFLTRALKAPTLRDAVPRLAGRAPDAAHQPERSEYRSPTLRRCGGRVPQIRHPVRYQESGLGGATPPPAVGEHTDLLTELLNSGRPIARR